MRSNRSCNPSASTRPRRARRQPPPGHSPATDRRSVAMRSGSSRPTRLARSGRRGVTPKRRVGDTRQRALSAPSARPGRRADRAEPAGQFPSNRIATEDEPLNCAASWPETSTSRATSRQRCRSGAAAAVAADVLCCRSLCIAGCAPAVMRNELLVAYGHPDQPGRTSMDSSTSRRRTSALELRRFSTCSAQFDVGGHVVEESVAQVVFIDACRGLVEVRAGGEEDGGGAGIVA